MLSINQIKKGDTFYECESGFNDEYIAVDDPYRLGDGWAIMALPSEGDTPIEFFCRDGFSGPKLYWNEEYV